MLLAIAGLMAPCNGAPVPILAKVVNLGDGELKLSPAWPEFTSTTLSNERELLVELLKQSGVSISVDAPTIHLEIGKVDVAVRQSRFTPQLQADAYRLTVTTNAVTIRGGSPAGVFYGIQTLVRSLSSNGTLPVMEITDWPDLPTRMIMVDPARQNENFDYYRRVIEWASRYGINAILVHLTDDQTACLHQPDYPELMHPHAWRPDEIRALVAFARKRHVELIPEIESFGHSRMFTRRDDFREILHQNRLTTGSGTWYGTSIPGFTNVLCPASEKAYDYLDRMYGAAAETFTNPVLHLGCDEVDMTSCARCEAKFPGISPSDWFRQHLLRCREIAIKHGRIAAFWGDMLIAHPEILDGLPTSGTIIYDWHYHPEVTSESAAMFRRRGFEVVACPALVCSPHIVIPDAHNYENIRRSAAIARELDLAGLNTTIWIPPRYMSDVLWPGIAYAGAQAWGGSNLDESRFAQSVARDLFGLEGTNSFDTAWIALAEAAPHMDVFNLCAWSDAATLAKAQQAAPEKRAEIAQKQEKLRLARKELINCAPRVTRNDDAWHAVVQSADILDYLYARFDAANDPTLTATAKLRRLEMRCVEIIGWIEADWRRNRYDGDPNMDGLYLPDQHLLHRFKKMQAYHRSIGVASP
ncbi:MAG: beta-N-acetylhexosaminidase [Candidatus Sumerlaeaceae bacterium]|nr:beta-N-acetylhexosaminidase [Candidatus Sumerlaeaceae bacterium]